MSSSLRVALLVLFCAAVRAAPAEAGALVSAGAARVDITPQGPIHLIGYANRAGETTEVVRPLHARALALGGDDQRPVVLITVDLCGVTDRLSDAVADALRQSHGLARAQVAVCATHTHTGPAIEGFLPLSFGRDLAPEHAERVRLYTAWVQERLIEVARAALAARRPSHLAWAEGSAGFAVQRRVIRDGRWAAFGEVPGGPVDHALPLLRVTDSAGVVRAVVTSYACHCTTLGGPNVIHPDWAGEAAVQVESGHAGAVALVAAGCGADAGPVPRGALAAAAVHGATIAAEVGRLLAGPMRALGPVTASSFRQIELPLDRRVTRDELETRAQSKNRLDAYAARHWLRELDAGGAPRTAVPYPLQAWSFGDRLAMVFLGGEVVSEYSLRLRRELDGTRLWVNAYANHVPCYIPSRRMYAEGGYEVDASIGKYGWPVRLAVETEDTIIAAVRALVPRTFEREARSAP